MNSACKNPLKTHWERRFVREGEKKREETRKKKSGLQPLAQAVDVRLVFFLALETEGLQKVNAKKRGVLKGKEEEKKTSKTGVREHTPTSYLEL